MPELPEVRSIQTQLSEALPFKIMSFEKSKVSSSIIHTPIEEILNVSITSINRRGKLLIFKLSNQQEILSHLGMSGTWLLSREKVIEKHTHFQMKSDLGVYMAYVDPRRFGHMYFLDKTQAKIRVDKLGVDLLDKSFTHKYFKNSLLRYPLRCIKVTLLDQSLFAGTGNYIANEICAHARVRPDRIVKTLSESEIKKLFKSISKVINPAIESGGTTFAGGYRDTTGSKGEGVNHLVVFYQKECRLCKKTKVIKTLLAQRGTYFCPKCQK